MPSERLSRAIRAAYLKWPHASHAILSLVPVERPGLGTLGVDQFWRLYYDEAALGRHTDAENATAILHEITHLLHRHHKRGKSIAPAQHQTWSVATDAAINSGLRAEGLAIGPDWVLPDTLGFPDGESAESYFRRLLDKQQEQQSQQPEDAPEDSQDDNQGQDSEPNPSDDVSSDSPPDDEQEAQDGQDGQDDNNEAPNNEENGDEGDEQSDDSQPSEDSQGDAPANDQAGEGEQEPGDGDGPGAEGEGCGDPQAGDGDGEPAESDSDGDGCQPQAWGTGGSCSDGQQRPWELGPPADDQPGLEEGDAESLIHVTARNAMSRGDGAGGPCSKLWAEGIINPPPSPAQRLLNLVRRYCDVTVGMGERSYRRGSRFNPSPRTMALPGNVGPMPRIVVILDTSGSMSAKDHLLGLHMIRSALSTFRMRDGITVVCGDTEGRTRQLRLHDPKLVELKGGGNTDMAAIVEAEMAQKPRPQMLLVCTDGWTPWPAKDPGIPVVACITRNKAESGLHCYPPPPWITVIELCP